MDTPKFTKKSTFLHFNDAVAASFFDNVGDTCGPLPTELSPTIKDRGALRSVGLFSLFLSQTPLLEEHKFRFHVWVAPATVECALVYSKTPGDIVARSVGICGFNTSNCECDAGDLGRRLAEICIDLNGKLCAMTATEMWSRCPECGLEDMSDAITYMIKHIIDCHPMRPLVKSADKE
jgi:hypothetical protein